MTHHRCWRRGSGSTSSPSSSPLGLAPCPDGAPPGPVGGTGPTDLQRLSWRVCCCCCCCCCCSLCSCRHGGEVIRLWLPSLSLSFAFVDPSCTLPLAVPSFGIYRSSPPSITVKGQVCRLNCYEHCHWPQFVCSSMWYCRSDINFYPRRCRRLLECLIKAAPSPP